MSDSEIDSDAEGQKLQRYIQHNYAVAATYPGPTRPTQPAKSNAPLRVRADHAAAGAGADTPTLSLEPQVAVTGPPFENASSNGDSEDSTHMLPASKRLARKRSPSADETQPRKAPRTGVQPVRPSFSRSPSVAPVIPLARLAAPDWYRRLRWSAQRSKGQLSTSDVALQRLRGCLRKVEVATKERKTSLPPEDVKLLVENI